LGRTWDWIDEDALRDTATEVERYRRGQSTGDHEYLGLRPGLEPQIATANAIAIGLSALLPQWGEYGSTLDAALMNEARQALADYYEIRQEEGGPGAVNVDTWHGTTS
jgi:hypothetical protein